VSRSPDRPALGEASPAVTEKVIGLILRYMCLALDGTFHGSVPGAWAADMPGYVECFASPFNYKFRRYYSMFEQDREFGSCGNFFLMLERMQGVLPPGRYEMNPPWMNAMYERLETVVQTAMERTPAEKDLTIMVIAPDWSDPKWLPTWIPGFNRALKEAPGEFKENSVHLKRQLTFEQDVTDVKFKQNTLCWLFAKRPVPDAVLKLFKGDK
jgi:Phosphorylated CTD interacting factor 1 WW domain